MRVGNLQPSRNVLSHRMGIGFPPMHVLRKRERRVSMRTPLHLFLLPAALLLAGCAVQHSEVISSGPPSQDPIARATPASSPAAPPPMASSASAKPSQLETTEETIRPPLTPGKDGKVHKTDAEWKELLTPEQYDITRQAGTERAFTGATWNNHEEGIYRCADCGQELFSYRTKFDSGTGWPSF